MAAKTFEVWKASANAECRKLCGMDLDDLPDCPYRDWWDNGVSSIVAAKRAIKRAKEG